MIGFDEAGAARTGADGATWSITVAARDDVGDPAAVRVAWQRDGARAALTLVPPDGAHRAWFDGVASLELRDVDGDGDGDGTDAAVLVLRWSRHSVVSLVTDGDDDEPAWIATLEQAEQLYVVRATGGALELAFTHLIAYTTSTDAAETVDRPTADVERVRYAYEITAGAVRLTRIEHEVAAAYRLPGVLDPARDPRFAAGAGSEVALARASRSQVS